MRGQKLADWSSSAKGFETMLGDGLDAGRSVWENQVTGGRGRCTDSGMVVCGAVVQLFGRAWGTSWVRKWCGV